MAKKTKAERYRIRYQILRDLGYSPQEAKRLQSHKMDVDDVRLKKDGTIMKYGVDYKEVKQSAVYDMYVKDSLKIDNDTGYSRWGMMTQDKRYKDKTSAMAHRLQKELKINNKQAYYLLYYQMTQEPNKSFKQLKKEIMTTEEWEMYAKGYTPSKKRSRTRKRKGTLKGIPKNERMTFDDMV